ncbi:MAG: glycosyltransferase family 39 protein [Lacunisphaera sp.]|nr:glycosyltransferase family 39 protein [Lacunisphaera sp.]
MRTAVGLCFALCLIAATWLLRAPGLEKKIWNVDEAVTFTMAQQILAGEIPYRDAVDQRNPLAPYVQAAVFAIAGDWNLRAQHAALALMIGLTAVLLWQTARRLGHESAGVAGALWFTLLCLLLPTVRDTMPAHTAWYLIFFSTAAFCALAQAWATGRRRWAAASGAAFALAVLAKQPGILDFGVALVLLGLGLWARPAERVKLARLLGALLAGFAAPLLLTGIYFAAHGAWADLVYYTWTYNNTLYVPEVPALERWQTIRVPFQLAWQMHPLAVVTGVLAAVTLLARVGARALRGPDRFDLPGWLILGWCAAGLVSTTLSGREFSHYSIQLIPGLSLACGWVTAGLWQTGRRWAGASRLRQTGLLLPATGLILWLLQPLPARLRAFDLPEPGVDTITQLVRRHTTPDERIFVWGYTPEVYAQSERLPATRFLYCTFLTGLIPWTNIDPLKNTDYAVVPGAWDDFLADWHRRPPALVADGRSQRAFMKYPLDRQRLLWPLIERDYAGVETAPTEPLGYWLFRRLEPASLQPLPTGLPPGAEVKINAPATAPGQTTRVNVAAPAGTHHLELYLDGRSYRRLRCAPEAAVSAAFFVLAADRTGAAQQVQAVALGADAPQASVALTLATSAPARVIGGPPLEFNGRRIPALESGNISGGPILPKQDAPDHWDAHAPSRVVYPRLPGMNSLAFAYGLEEAAIAKDPPAYTDGIEAVVQVEDAAGRITPVYRRFTSHLDARPTRGQLHGYTPLPPGDGGRIILLITPGPQFNAAFDWSYWRWIRADTTPLALLVEDAVLPPVRLETPGAPRQAEFNGSFITVTGAPATIDFPAQPHLSELTGRFGLLDTAWTGPVQAGPVRFAVELVGPEGGTTVLFERSLDPARAAEDRGEQKFLFRLPQPLAGLLRFSVRPGKNPAQAHAFWSGLSANRLRTSLQWGEDKIPARADSAGLHGFLNTEDEGRVCLVAHAPATLAYDWQEGLVRLTAEYGLMSAAYTQNETEGVVFVIEAEDAGGARHELFRRHLAPLTQPADRGPQPLTVEIPALPGGRIHLRTLPPPSGHLNAAWSYWRDLRAGH